jgi:glycosyltransferase involved in cell wall biosynthesis
MSGGGSVVSYEITNALVSLGHKVTVLVPDVDWNTKKFVPPMHQDVEIIRVPTPARTNLKMAARLCESNLRDEGKKTMKRKEFDLTFTIFHPFHLVPKAAVSCAKAFGKPSIVKIDDAFYEKASGLKALQRRFEKRSSSSTLKDATEILSLNEEMRKAVSVYYNISESKIFVMPNGIDIPFFDLPKSKREQKVVFSGVMYYHRGLDVLMDAVPSVINKIPWAKFILLGEGPEMQRLRQIADEKKINSEVDFRGWIERTLIPHELGNASVGIGPLQLTPLTSKSIPIKVLEYMASSLPIIAKRGTLSDDVLVEGENGYYIDNANDLSNRIISLLENPELAEKMGSKSRMLVEKFSWKNLLTPILQRYQK